MEQLIPRILSQTRHAAEIQQALTAIPALGPENGGQGELAKCRLVEDLLRSVGITDLVRLDSPDPRVESGLRPNLVARRQGSSARTLWLFAHLDVVPPGEGWTSSPWDLRREGDLIYGRGVEDNQQAITSMIVLPESLQALEITPQLSLGLVFMSDEENGSKHGLGYVLDQAPELFDVKDLYIVPDGGTPDGAGIEIAEKAQLWCSFSVQGQQCHASMPQQGINALVGASRLVLELAADLPKSFPEQNPLFDPPYSTFVPTRHTSPDTAINILPGKDKFYLDCRIIPGIPLAEVRKKIDEIIARTVRDTHCSIEMSIVQENPASTTPASCLVVSELAQAIQKIYGVVPRAYGIGGGTVASLLRKRRLHTAVWSCLRNTCHQPNECSSLTATCKDAAVFAWILQNASA